MSDPRDTLATRTSTRGHTPLNGRARGFRASAALWRVERYPRSAEAHGNAQEFGTYRAALVLGGLHHTYHRGALGRRMHFYPAQVP
jgi:hypothetical protein